MVYGRVTFFSSSKVGIRGRAARPLRSAHICLNLRRTLTMPVRRNLGRMTDGQGPVSIAFPSTCGPCTRYHATLFRSLSQLLPSRARTRDKVGGYPVVLARWRRDRRAGNCFLIEGTPAGRGAAFSRDPHRSTRDSHRDLRVPETCLGDPRSQCSTSAVCSKSSVCSTSISRS